MRLDRIAIENVFSIGWASIALEHRGVVLVQGRSFDEGSSDAGIPSNGSGKSSLINKALLWGLFGKTAGGLKGDDVINRFTGKSALVSIDLFSRGSIYRIIRSRGKGSSNLVLYRKSENISTRDVRTTQAKIEEIIGMDFKTFVNTDFFGQGNAQPFLQLTSSVQREVLESILPMEVLEKWIENSKGANKFVDAHIKTLDTSLLTVEAKKDALKEQRKHIISRQFQWQTNQKNSITLIQGNIGKLKATDIGKEIRKIDLELQKFRTLDFKSAIVKLNHPRSPNVAQATVDVATLENKLADLKVIDKSFSLGICPTCGSTVNSKDNKHKTKLKEVSKELDDAKKTLRLQEQIEDEIRTKITRLQSDEREVKQLLNKRKDLKDNSIAQAIKECEQRLATTAGTPDPFVDLLNSLDNSLMYFDNYTKDASKRKQALIDEKEIVKFWESAHSVSFKNLLFDRVCPYLEDRVNTHLRGLNNSQIQVKISTTKSLKSGDTKRELNITVSSETGGNSYHALSGGEQQMVDFAMGLALSDLANSQASGRSNVLILDEPFVGLDSRNASSIVSYLNRELLNQKESIFLISNEDSLTSLIPNRIMVEKKNGISSIQTRC
jgi:DNA repair exonuclease SbcCD ATPase subunit